MWKFCYFESQSWSGSFLSCRIGFWIRNDFVHVRGRRKKWWFYFSRDQNIKTEFLSLSGISNPSVRCGFVILQARFIPPLWFHGNTELHQKNTSLFYIRTIESFFEVTDMNWEGLNLHELAGNRFKWRHRCWRLIIINVKGYWRIIFDNYDLLLIQVTLMLVTSLCDLSMVTSWCRCNR